MFALAMFMVALAALHWSPEPVALPRPPSLAAPDASVSGRVLAGASVTARL
jgi:hypothetical protein